MSGYYFRSPEMHGDRPFKCYNCHKTLITNIKGDYELELHCPRCKANIIVKCREKLPLKEK